jgi:hypothetical protein
MVFIYIYTNLFKVDFYWMDYYFPVH